MSFYVRNCLKFKPFLIGLVGMNHKLEDVVYARLVVTPQRNETVVDETEFKEKKRAGDAKGIIIATMKNCRMSGISVKISVNGESVLGAGFGLKDVEKTMKMQEETPADIASITKLFTAYLIMKLFEEEKFSRFVYKYPTQQQLQYPYHYAQTVFLQTQINYLFANSGDTHPLTLEYLLTHRAGVRNFTNLEHLYHYPFDSRISVWNYHYRFPSPTNIDMVWLRNQQTKRNYSGIGYEMLGMFLEICANGTSYYNILHDELQGLNLAGLYLHRVQDVNFDTNRGYSVTKNQGHAYTEMDTSLVAMRQQLGFSGQDHNYDPALKIDQNNRIKTLQNAYGRDVSMMYASEGLMGSVGELAKFGNMYLRMEQDLNGGRPLSSSLAKLCWSYIGTQTVRDDGDEWYDEFGDLVVNSGMYTVGSWRVQTELQNQDKQEYKTTASMGGAGFGFGSSLYVMTMKNEDYAGIYKFDTSAVHSPTYHGFDVDSAVLPCYTERTNNVNLNIPRNPSNRNCRSVLPKNRPLLSEGELREKQGQVRGIVVAVIWNLSYHDEVHDNLPQQLINLYMEDTR